METRLEGITAEELLARGDIGRCELIEGELVRMSPSGFEHGRIAMRIGRMLAEYVDKHRLGVVTAAETGFQIEREPDTVRAPDVGFVTTARVSPGQKQGFFDGPPDLAVEVISPHDLWSEVTTKARAWLKAGCREVWIVDPDTHTVHICGPHDRVTVLEEADTLTCGDFLPELRIAVREIFAP